MEIIKKLGTPSEEEIKEMNPHYKEFKFPLLKPQKWDKIFPSRVDPLAIDLVAKALVYSPSKRIGAYEALSHPYFDELRDQDLRLPNGNCIPDLFDFNQDEVKAIGKTLIQSLIPTWYS